MDPGSPRLLPVAPRSPYRPYTPLFPVIPFQQTVPTQIPAVPIIPERVSPESPELEPILPIITPVGIEPNVLAVLRTNLPTAAGLGLPAIRGIEPQNAGGNFPLSPDIIEYIELGNIRMVADEDAVNYLRLAFFVRAVIEAVNKLLYPDIQKVQVGKFYVGEDSIPYFKQLLRSHPGYPKVIGFGNLGKE